MIELDLNIGQMCELLEAELMVLPGVSAAKIKRRKVRLCLDSRVAGPGMVFWPLVGKHFDAHQFVSQVMGKEVLMSVINQDQVEHLKPIQAYVAVDDTNEGLLRLARKYQQRFKLLKVAVTGSNGKTTTKEMLNAVFSRRYKTLATLGNLNNQIGVPLTLFRLQKKHEAAIVEMGTNSPGEIKPLSMAVQPNIAVITNVGESHLEGLGNVRNVFKEKASITGGLIHGGVLVVNADDPHLCRLRSTSRYKLQTFGVKRGQIRPQDLTWDENACAHFRIGRVKMHLKVPGIHSVYNALAAFTVGVLARIPKTEIATALNAFQSSNMRMEFVSCNGFQVVSDCYNANPASTKMALETVGNVRCSGRRIAVLGDMLELGRMSSEHHDVVGRLVPQMNFDLLFAFGAESKQIQQGALQAGMHKSLVKHYMNRQELIEHLIAEVHENDIVLIKGSRGMRLEEVVTALKNLERVETLLK